jgi:alkanesulfonate monooxygenase
MPVEMIGWIAPRVSSEVVAPHGPPFDVHVIAATARIHEKADFNRALIGYFSDGQMASDWHPCSSHHGGWVASGASTELVADTCCASS